MSCLDHAINDYFGQADVIAELINHMIYKKEKVDLSELSPVDLVPIFHKLREHGSEQTLEQLQNEYRNLFLMKTEEIYYALLVETEMSYELPIKAFLFESGLYATEADTWELLEDGGLLPCLTVVLYLSPADWGGYYHLHEMYKKTNETLKKYAPDYHLNIIEPAKITEDKIAELSGDLGGVLRFVKKSKDAAAAMEFLSGGAYAQMGMSAQNLIQCISDCMDFPK